MSHRCQYAYIASAGIRYCGLAAHHTSNRATHHLHGDYSETSHQQYWKPVSELTDRLVLLEEFAASYPAEFGIWKASRINPVDNSTVI